MRTSSLGLALALVTSTSAGLAIEPEGPPPASGSGAPPASGSGVPPAPVTEAAPSPGTVPPPPPLEPPPGADGPGAGRPDQAPSEMGDGGAPDDGGGMRFRGGVGGLVGGFFPGSVLQIGPEGRLGLQIDDLMAVYASFGFHAGAGFDVGEDSSSVSLGAALFASPMFELTLSDLFFVGLGPQFLYGSFVSADAATSGQDVGATVSAFSGLMPGFKIKTGVGFGSDAPNRRKQFTLALDVSVIFGDRVEITDAGEIDAGVAVGVLPMLAIGYDAK